MPRLTIKNKFTLVGALASFSILAMVGFTQYATDSLSKLDHIDLKVAQVQEGMLTLRRNEKDFLARNDLKYQNKLNRNHDTLTTLVSSLKGAWCRWD